MSFEVGATLSERMRAHAGDATHLYGCLMRAMADDWDAGGPVREICAGWEDAPPGTVVQLRLLGGLFRIVLRGGAPDLTRYYPCLGGEEPPSGAWPAVRAVLSSHVDELHDALRVAPQTNEAGRSAALLVGVFRAVAATGARDVRLLEPGASAGLNLLVDRFRIEGDGWAHGPADSRVRLASAVRGAASPEAFRIVERRGCDLAPVDPRTDEGRLRLRSFVWPWQLERHERLAAALDIAAAHPVEVDRAPAAPWLRDQLEARMTASTLTVVWQSVTRLYWPPAEIAHADEVIRDAATRMPIAHVAMEHPLAGSDTAASLTLALNGGAPELLGTVADHGLPVTLTAQGR
jgi:hypothetical protein